MKNDTWKRISSQEGLSEDFVREHTDKLDWKCISRCQNLSEAFIEEYESYVDWEVIGIYQTLSEPFIEKNLNKMDVSILRRQKLSIAFIKKYKDANLFGFFWKTLSKNPYLTEEMLEKYKDKWYWMDVFKYIKLKKTCILYLTKHSPLTEKNMFSSLSKNHYLTEELIETYEDKLNWHSLAGYAKLSESFIIKHICKWTEDNDWHNIFKYQKVSFDFVKTYIHRVDELDLIYLQQNKNISKQQLQELKNLHKSLS